MGKVLDAQGRGIPFATVLVMGTAIGSSADERGAFVLDRVPAGRHGLRASALSYRPDTLSVAVVAGTPTSIDFTLGLQSNDLDQVVVSAQRTSTRVAQSGFNVELLESKPFQNLTADINQVLKTTPGITLRESGGLGSGFNLSLNGLSGNQIRYFIDGVPMENFGSALSLNNFPINLVEHIEVYKGVVPVHLGADALGGAINIIPARTYRSYLDFSYSYGSFNTHRLALNARHHDRKKGFYLQTRAFLNHSDNNYRMDSVKVWDLELGNLLGHATVDRFHNDYTAGMANVQVGLVDRSFADRLSLGFTAARNRKAYQHPDNNIKRVFGQFHTRNTTYLSTLSYRKTFSKLRLAANVSLGQVRENVIDTSRLKYNWAGDFIRRPEGDPKGELYERRTLFKLTDGFLRGNLTARYTIARRHLLTVNLTQQYLRRTGEDEVDPLNRSFTSPNSIRKTIYAGGYTYQSANDALQLSAFVKRYRFGGRVITQDTENNDQTSQPTFGDVGYGLAQRWRINDFITTKASFERAYRLPEPYEILGDGIYVNVNPNLQPEKSYNFNLGVQTSSTWSKWTLSSDVNVFLRSSSDFIRFLPLGPFGEYENLTRVRSEGVEAALDLNYNNLLFISGNVTYQHITDRNEFDEGLPNINYRSRVPNIPYLLANTRVGLRPIDKRSIRLGLFWSTTFVESFFLHWENLGSQDSKNIIPAQFTHQLDLEVALEEGKYNISLSAVNLTDAVIYDNFSIQLPGRAFYAKFRTFIHPNP